MATKHLLSCECGNQLAVDANQAGRRIDCTCGRTLEIPSMRAIRELPVQEETAETRPRPTRSWNSTAGVFFALGAVVMIVGLAIGILGTFYRWHFTLPPPSQEEIDRYVEEVDVHSPEDLWTIWHMTVEEGLGEYDNSPYIIMRGRARVFGRFANLGFAVAAIGLLAVATAFFLRQKNQS